MTQFTKYKAPIDSFELRHAMMGILKPGRYAGFDKMTSNDGETGLSIKISHDGTRNKSINNKSNIPISNYGVFITETGQIYREDAGHSIDVVLNSQVTSSVRYDFLIATTVYSENTEGNDVTYSIESNISPAIVLDGLWVSNNPNTIVLGLFTLNGPTGDYSGVTYQKNNETLFLGGDQLRFTVAEEINGWISNYLNENPPGIVYIGDSEIVNGVYEVQPEDAGKIIMVRGYTGAETEIECYITSIGSQGRFKETHFIWDELPIRITKNISSTTNIRTPSDKQEKTRVQYSKISVFISYETSNTEYIVSGDMASV